MTAWFDANAISNDNGLVKNYMPYNATTSNGKMAYIGLPYSLYKYI